MNDAEFGSFADILDLFGNVGFFAPLDVEYVPCASIPWVTTPRSMASDSTGTSTSHGAKRKAVMIDVIDTQFDKLNTGLDKMAEAIGSGSVYAKKLSNAAKKQVNISKCQVIAI